MRPLNLILLVVHWGFPYIKDMNGLWSSLKGSGIPRQSSNRARRRPRLSPAGHRAWRLRHGWGSWRPQNETGRSPRKIGGRMVEWWNEDMTYLFGDILDQSWSYQLSEEVIRSEPTTSRFEWKNGRKDRTYCGNTEINSWKFIWFILRNRKFIG